MSLAQLDSVAPLAGVGAREAPRGLAAAGWWPVEPVEDARAALHRRPFLLRHPLAEHPLFRPDRLVALAKEAARRPGDLYFDAGVVGLNDKWGKIPVPDLPVDEVIRRIETAKAWIIMKHVERSPAYREVLDEFARAVRDIAGPRQAAELLSPEMLVLITSPHRLTPFHIDAEPNFLVQIVGEKDVWICDPADRGIVTEEERENYYAVDRAAASYKPHAPDKAWRFRLKPGDAVHIPTHGAHWVQNADNLSVSLSLNFEFPASKYRDVYCANHRLRRLGLHPAPPGGWSDPLKVGAMRALGAAKAGLTKAKAALRPH